MRLVHRWQAAKRQRQCRQNAERRRRHGEAERQRRKRLRDQASMAASVSADGSSESSSAKVAEETGVWSRSKRFSADFCDRVGCYDLVRRSCRAEARYCGDACREAMRRVLDRERKWLRRNTKAGRFKRQLEYERARLGRVAQRDLAPEPGDLSVADGLCVGRRLSGFL